MADQKIREGINFLRSGIKKLSGVNVMFGDQDPGASTYPIIILKPEDSGEIRRMASKSYECIIPLRIIIRVDKKDTLKAYEILEKIVRGTDELRPERGYTFGNSPEIGIPPRGSINPEFNELGFFDLSADFQINEII